MTNWTVTLTADLDHPIDDDKAASMVEALRPYFAAVSYAEGSLSATMTVDGVANGQLAVDAAGAAVLRAAVAANVDVSNLRGEASR